MNKQLRTYLDEQAQAVDQDVQLALELCNGNPIQALRTTLIANAFLVEENERLKAQVSAGFGRRQTSGAKK